VTNNNMNNQMAMLMGNGVSIAANKELFIPRLTKRIRKRFEEIDPKREAPDRVLASLAKRGRDTGDPYADFEAMIGPLDQQSDNLHDLAKLAELVADEVKPVRRALDTISTFVQGLRRLGVGHTLDIIASESKASWGRSDVVDRFMDQALHAVTGPITIGNLNYDSLGMAAMLRSTTSSCDMARGDQRRKVDLMGDGVLYPGAPLRTSMKDFPGRRVRLVHPHGSLNWLKDPDTGRVYKFDIGTLRRLDFWAQWRDGVTEWEPQVVLTNQSAKSKMVERPPFDLAYDVLYQRLVKADRWLIAGYSFRDECVNDLLAAAWQEREVAPMVMVITMGDDLDKRDVLNAIGHSKATDPRPRDFLDICRCGIEGSMACSTWLGWAGQVDDKAA
jgi:hypothetical protein